MDHILIKILVLVLISSKLMAQGPPTRSTAFYCSCSGNSSTPIKTQNFTLKHYIIKADAKREDIAKFCSHIEFPASLSVAADGGESFIDIIYNCENDPFSFLNNTNYELNGFTMGDVDANGILSIELKEKNRVVLKYRHPIIPPTVATFNSVYPQLRFFNRIKIYRPPVAMIHGLWADRSSFDDMETYLLNTAKYEQFQLYKIDYKSTNDRSFSVNESVAKKGIDQVVSQCYDNFIAVNKADVVCHSMGGLLTKKFVQSPFYKYNLSVNKIITCNTPHQGSQMANWLLDTSSGGGLAAGALLTSLGLSTLNGAVSDLRVNSPALSSIQNGLFPVTPFIKVHALNTLYPHQISTPDRFDGPILAYVMFQIANSCGGSYISSIFDSNESDLVVALESQKGGLTDTKTTTFNSQVHVGSVANQEVMAAVNSKLGLPVTNFTFANQFSPKTLKYDLGFPCTFSASAPSRQVQLSVASLDITAPIANQNVIAGSNLAISFTSTEIDSVTAYVHQTKQNFAIQKVKYTDNTFNLPTDNKLLGPVELILVGYSFDGEMVATASVIYNQTTTATLDSIYPYPTTINLNQTDSLTLDIFGKYSDGIDRNISFDNTLVYNFKTGTASKVNKQIVLNIAANDTLKVSRGSLTTQDVFINNLSTGLPENCHIVSSIDNDGAGSLRRAVDCVNFDQIISFDASIQNTPIVLRDVELEFYKSVSIINTLPEKVTIQSQTGNLFKIFGSAVVNLENVHLIVPDDSFVAIENSGKLTLKKVLITTQNSGGPRLINHGEITITGLVEMKD